MPNTREKLIELIISGHQKYYEPDSVGNTYEVIADHLIANGVTVQEWISQTELPWMGEEIAKLCIRYMEDYADFHGYASSKKVKAHIVRLLELEKDGRIAILPQPPKGE